MFVIFQDVREEFKHPQLVHMSGRPIQFDAYIPRLKLAFEYQVPLLQVSNHPGRAALPPNIHDSP